MLADTVTQISLNNLAIVTLVGFGAALLLNLLPKVHIPTSVLEILAGILIGPSVLALVHPDAATLVMRTLGLSFLLFLGGMELEIDQLRGRALKRSLTGYGIAFAFLLLCTSALWGAGFLLDPLLIAIAVSSTSLGVIIPILKDTGQLHTPFGRRSVASGTVAEFAPVVLLALFFSSESIRLGRSAAILGGFIMLFLLVVVMFWRAGRSERVAGALLRAQDTTAQIRIRAAVALVICLSAVAADLKLDAILGAFLAGALLSTIDEDRDRRYGNFKTKLNVIGFGVFVPVFFVMTGVTFDLKGLLSEPPNLARVLVFLALLLAGGMVSAASMRRELGNRRAAAFGFLQATSLSLLVVTTEIGLALGKMRPVNATALVAAGMVSVLAFPAIGQMLMGGAQEGVDETRDIEERF